jgi:hypothetical protein
MGEIPFLEGTRRVDPVIAACKARLHEHVVVR